jgi:DNA end-binding protein Ku
MLEKKTLAPIKFKRVSAKTGREVPYNQIVKGYEHEKGKFVIVTDKDFKAANVKATQSIDIENFVLLEQIDPMLFEKPYYIVPTKGGEKGYFLLKDALEKSEKVAIGKVVIRTKQHLAAIMPRGKYLVLELLRFSHAVLETHEVDYLDDVKKPGYTPKELKMAESLIKEMTAEWDPDQYEDTYHKDLLKQIQQKIRGGESETVEEKAEKPDDTNVVDLLSVLRDSLDKKKKRGEARRGRGHE